jgi:flagellar hook-associated protein 2
MSTSVTAPAPNTFTGVSSYASDLQQVINRAVQIASLPLQLMQNRLQDLDNKSSELSTLDTKFAALQTAIQQLDSSLGVSSYSATSSDSSLVGVSVGAGAAEGSYTIDVSNPGSASTSISDSSLPAVADPNSTSISTSSSFTLTVNGTTTTIAPPSNTLSSLAQAINAASAGVQASVINIGGSTPKYQLVLRSAELGPDTIQLNDGSQDLMDTLTTGGLATYDVNGLGNSIQSNSRTVTLAPGLTINLLQATPSGQPVTVTVSRSAAAASTAVSNFVTAYNAVRTELDTQVGPNAGPLSGQSIVYQLFSSLSQMGVYSGSSGAVRTLADMGVTLDKTGQLTFDSAQFSSDSIDALQNFLGSASTGGFLQLATNDLTGVEDTTIGSLKTAIHDLNSQIANQNTQISDETQKITDLQNTVTQQVAAADALIASLESQKTYMTGLFQSMMYSNEYSNSGNSQSG